MINYLLEIYSTNDVIAEAEDKAMSNKKSRKHLRYAT